MNEIGKLLTEIGQTTNDIMSLYRAKRGALAMLLEDCPDMPETGREYSKFALTALEELYNWRFRWADVFHKFQEDGATETEIWGCEEVSHG